MAAERPLRLDRNTAAGVLARQADRGEPESGERHRVLGLLVEAQRRLRTEEIAAAERALRRALAIAPGHADALNLMSVVQGRQGRAAEGERCSRQALARKPDDPGYRLNLANRLNEQSRVEEAIEAYGRVLEVAPRHLQALKALARTLAEAGRLEEAAGVARSALDCPDAEAETLAECGEITAAYGDVRGALALYRRACEELPDQPGWWLQVARLELRLDQAEAGVAAALRVLALEPGHAEAIILQSAGLHRMRQFERVLQVLDGVEIEGPHAANAANLRAMALVAQGRVEEGLGAMRAVEGLAPDSVTRCR